MQLQYFSNPIGKSWSDFSYIYFEKGIFTFPNQKKIYQNEEI